MMQKPQVKHMNVSTTYNSKIYAWIDSIDTFGTTKHVIL